MSQKYLALAHPSMKEAIQHHNFSILKLAVLGKY